MKTTMESEEIKPLACPRCTRILHRMLPRYQNFYAKFSRAYEVVKDKLRGSVSSCNRFYNIHFEHTDFRTQSEKSVRKT